MDQHRRNAFVGDYFGIVSGRDQEKENGCQMNQKQLLTLVVCGLLIGGLGYVLYNQKAASWKATDTAMGQKILKEFPLNDITQVRLKQADGELTLAKVDEQWTVKERWNYPANFNEVGDLLRKVWELKGVQTLEVGPSQYGRLKLLSPDKEKGTNTATLLDFKDKSGKTVRSLLLGKSATRGSEDNSSPYGGGAFPVGRYIAVPENTRTVWLVSETFSDAEPKPDRWLNKDFFKVEKLKSISITHTNETNSWKISREKEGGDLELADKKPGEEFDKNKAVQAGSALSYPSFNDVVNPATKPEETGMDKATLAKIETFDDFVYTVKVSPSTNDNYNLQLAVEGSFARQRTPGKDEKPDDKTKLDKEFQDKTKKLDDKLKQEKGYEKWTYVVSKWTVDPLLKDRKDFLAEKKEEKKGDTNATTSIPPVEIKPTVTPTPAPEIKAEVKPTEAKKDATSEVVTPKPNDSNKPATTPASETPPPLPESKPK
jgi:hypothetical protein